MIIDSMYKLFNLYQILINLHHFFVDELLIVDVPFSSIILLKVERLFFMKDSSKILNYLRLTYYITLIDLFEKN